MKAMTLDRSLVALMPGGTVVRPSPLARPPRRPGRFDLHAVSRPARVFTGDFYTAHADRSGLHVVLGDVAGKGLEAAVVMAMIQEELERWIRGGVQEGPEATLFRLQELLKPLLPDNRFATAVVAHLDRKGALRLANAGHCAPLIARVDGSAHPVGPTGPVLGILERPRWSSVTTTLAPDETLLLYSDGLAEARSREGIDFGETMLASAFLELAGESGAGARDVAAGLLEKAGRHAAGTVEDDLTVVVIRRA